MCEEINEKEIVRQIKFYFSDVNLVRDKFLKEKTLENDGWITIDCLLTFNRLKKLAKDSQTIITALKNDDANFFEIDEENKKIRRSKDIPLPAISFRKYLDQNKNNIFYINGFPLELTLDAIQDFLSSNKITTKYVKMLAEKNKKFSGTIYVLCDTDASAQLLADKNLKLSFAETLLTVQDYTEHEESSNKEIGVVSKKRKSNPNKEKSHSHLVNALLRIRDLPTTIKSKEIKDCLKSIKNVGWVDRNEDGSAIARFAEDNAASLVVEKLKDTDGKLKIGDIELIVEIITGEEESTYWANHKNTKTQRKRRTTFASKKRRMH